MTDHPVDDADERQHSGIQVIARSSKIMRTLSAHGLPCGMSLAAIASAVDLPRSTVQRIINALAAEHLVEPAGASGFRLGPALGQMLYQSNADVVSVIKPYAEQLSLSLQETVCLASLNLNKLRIIESFVGEQPLRVVPQIGIAPPLHVTAAGKALLARMDDATVLEWLAREEQPHTTTPQALLQELAQVRAQGFAQDMDDVVLGVSAIAVAINTYRGPYALMLLVPTARLQRDISCFQQAMFGLRDVLEKLLSNATP